MITISFVACKKAETPNFNQTEKLSDQQIEISERLQQIADISLTVLSENQDLLNKYVKSLKNKLAKFPDEEESLTFMEILKNESFIEPGFSEIFVKKYQEKFYNNDYSGAEKYGTLTEKIKSRLPGHQLSTKPTSANASIASSTLYSSTTDSIFIASLGGQLYFLYSENFAALDSSKFWTTSDPMSDVVTSVTVKRRELYCDVRRCYGLRDVTQTVTGEWAETTATLVANLNDRVLDPTPPQPPVVLCSNLTANTIPNLDDRYSISNNMPTIRLLENIRFGFWSGSNSIKIHQGYAKLDNPTVNSSSGNLAASAANREVGSAKIKRREARKGIWITFGPIWNPY